MSKTRYQLDLTDKAKDALVKLQKKAGHASMREMMVKALALYELAVDHRLAGGKVILENKNGTQETLKLL